MVTGDLENNEAYYQLCNDMTEGRIHGRSLVFSPTCCKEHQTRCAKKYHLQTKEWRFEEEVLTSPIRRRLFDPYRRTTASSECRNKCVADIDERVEQERKRNLMENFEKIKMEDLDGSPIPEEVKMDPIKKEMHSHEKESEDILENLKEQKVYTNPYLVLLNRLDEEEGVKTPSLEDKLKLAEDHLRISTAKFCKACEELIEGHAAENFAAIQNLLKPDFVQEALRPKVFDSSLRPPQTLTVTALKETKDDDDGEDIEMTKGMSSKEKRKLTAMKQGFFLPADTWFTKEKHDEVISTEELELLNSTSTKAFIRFLNERKKEPPKILQEIQKKLQRMDEKRPQSRS